MSDDVRFSAIEKKLEKLESRRKDFWDKLQISTGLVMPVVIAVTGYYLNEALKNREFVQSSAFNDLEFKQTQQLKEWDARLTEKLRDRVEQGERLDREIRYLQLIYADLYSKENERRAVAINLISALDPELRQKLGEVVKADDSATSGQKAIAESIVATATQVISINKSLNLSLDKIGIYYDNDDEDEKLSAESIRSYLTELGVKQIVQLYPSEKAKLRLANFPAGIQVRYDTTDGVEHDAADSLSSVLKERFPSQQVGTYAVNQVSPPTPGFLSIFLVASERNIEAPSNQESTASPADAGLTTAE